MHLRINDYRSNAIATVLEDKAARAELQGERANWAVQVIKDLLDDRETLLNLLARQTKKTDGVKLKLSRLSKQKAELESQQDKMTGQRIRVSPSVLGDMKKFSRAFGAKKVKRTKPGRRDPRPVNLDEIEADD